MLFIIKALLQNYLLFIQVQGTGSARANHTINVGVMGPGSCCPAKSSCCSPQSQEYFDANWNWIWPWVILNLKSTSRSSGPRQDFPEMRYLLEGEKKNSFWLRSNLLSFFLYCVLRERGKEEWLGTRALPTWVKTKLKFPEKSKDRRQHPWLVNNSGKRPVKSIYQNQASHSVTVSL